MSFFRFICLCLLCNASVWAQKAPQPAGPGCAISQLKSIGLYIHSPQERTEKALEWLERSGKLCTYIQISMIASNKGSWLGHGDTVHVSEMIDGLLEAKIAGNADKMAETYNSKGKEGQAGVELNKTTPPRLPVVPAQVAGVGAAVLVQPQLPAAAPNPGAPMPGAAPAR